MTEEETAIQAPAAPAPGGGVVAIVGRPNVGKSSLFNRLVGERRAIVFEQPGTTRDRLYAQAEWRGRTFTLVDTGGLEPSAMEAVMARVQAQAELAIAQADVLVFLVDVTSGLTAEDEELARRLRRSGKPIVLGVNKADSHRRRLEASEFYALGLGEPIPLSAVHGTGTGDLLDAVVASLPPAAEEPQFEGLRLAIVGRPNVGKSTLLNRILGEERSITDEEPGTTRDVVDVPFRHGEADILLLDTAGLRRRGRIRPGVERYGSLRALRAIARCDVALLLVDAQEGVTTQDTHVAGYVLEEGKGLVVALNKWDLARGEGQEFRLRAERHLEESFSFAPWAPRCFISARTGRGVSQLLDTALEVYHGRRLRIPTPRLNRWLRQVAAAHPPPSRRGRALRLYYATQASTAPPTFVFFVNDVGLVHWSYERYLENELRRAFGFRGTPLRLRFRPRRQEELRA